MILNKARSAKVLSRFLAGALLLPATAVALDSPHLSKLEQIRTLHDALAAGAPVLAPVKCGLPAVSFALEHRGKLTPLQSAALRAVMTRQNLEISRTDGRFRVHFDTSDASPNTPALLDPLYQRIPGTAGQFVDSLFAILNTVVHAEVDSLGYPFPPSDGTLGGGPEFDIYIEQLHSPGFAEYGETDPDSSVPDGGRTTTSITVDNDFSWVTPDKNKGIPALEVTLAHEFHHAIQLGRYAFWPADRFLYEMTSVWMEDVVYTDVNDYLNYLVSSTGQFRNPDVALNSSDDIMYSRGIWCQFIAKKYGADAMRATWEQVSLQRPLPAMDAALRLPVYATNLQSAFAEWTLWNYFTGSRSNPDLYYPEGASFPLISEMPIGFTPPSRTVIGSIQYLSSFYYAIPYAADTLTIVIDNVNLASALAGDPANAPQLGFTFILDTRPVDDSYEPTASPLYFKLVPDDDRANWWSWNMVRATVGGQVIPDGTPFPNPFVADGSNAVYIPAAGSTGLLTVFSSALDRIYSGQLSSKEYFGKQVFAWDGITDKGTPARSGIYIFVLTLPGKTITGKIALVRR